MCLVLLLMSTTEIMVELLDLPEVICHNILSKLPVKDIVKCKVLCKASNEFIENFMRDRWSIRLHHEQSVRIGDRQRVVYIRSDNFHSRDPQTADFDSFGGVAVLPYQRLHVNDVEIVGSCHGLLCLCEPFGFKTIFVLLNPATRESSILPWTPFEVKDEESHDYLLYPGFGYDSNSDDYKVLRIAQAWKDPISDNLRCEAMVYSLSTNTWKKVADVLPFRLFPLPIFGIHLNGSIHFLGFEKHKQTLADRIVAFNLGDESYHSVPQPDGFAERLRPEEGGRWLSVGVLDGCLSQVESPCMALGDRHYDVWIMKEYGVQNTWSKICRIEYPETPIRTITIGRHHGIPPGLQPISYSRNKKKIFFIHIGDSIHPDLVSYDLEEMTLQRLVHPIARDMAVYQETLTLPLADTVVKAEKVIKLAENAIGILMRLPIKYLVRFKSVSSLWYDLISDHRFAIYHLINSSHNTNSKLHVVFHDFSFGLCFMEFGSFVLGNGLYSQLPHLGQYTIVVGASHGLICLCGMSRHYGTYPLALYNPTTGSINRLPHSPLRGVRVHFFGFGYDVSNQDYRVVMIGERYVDRRWRWNAQVYRWKTNSWNWVKTCPWYQRAGLQSSGVCVNGVVHWVVSRVSFYDNTLQYAIAGFDLCRERDPLVPQSVSLVPQPQALALAGQHVWGSGLLQIGMVDGCLCQVCHYWLRNVVWVMREYGVQTSWVLLYNIEPSHLILRPLTFSENRRELFFMALVAGNNNLLVFYDLQHRRLYTYGVLVPGDVQMCQETLVSAAGRVRFGRASLEKYLKGLIPN